MTKPRTPDRQPPDPEVAAQRAVERARAAGIGPHGRVAEAELAHRAAAESLAARGTPRSTSAEAVDGLGSRTERAEVARAAAEAAARRAEVEASVSPSSVQTAAAAAGNRRDPEKTFAQVARAVEDGPDNLTVTVAEGISEDVSPITDSPHGRQAEKADPWVAARWAPHGDMNVTAPAVYAAERPEDPNDFSKSPSPIPR